MCKDCGCSITTEKEHNHHHTHDENIKNNPLMDKKSIEVVTKILEANDKEAEHNREHFHSHNIFSINLMSSPGSGKTSLLEALADVAKFNFGVIEGDLETNYDAERLIKKGIRAYQITTGTACHLDALMVHKALHHFPLEGLDVLFVENVGNLVCPASYDVGTDINVVLLSTPEGDDKVLKYPTMFRKADLVIISKMDLKEHFNFDVNRVKRDIKKLNHRADFIELSTKDGSIEKVAEYIEFKRKFGK